MSSTETQQEIILQVGHVHENRFTDLDFVHTDMWRFSVAPKSENLPWVHRTDFYWISTDE